jgi:hypothetical protein
MEHIIPPAVNAQIGQDRKACELMSESAPTIFTEEDENLEKASLQCWHPQNAPK